MTEIPQRLPIVSPGDRLNGSFLNGRSAESKAVPVLPSRTSAVFALLRPWFRPKKMLLLGIVGLVGRGAPGWALSGPSVPVRAAADGAEQVAAEGVVEGARRTVSVYPELTGTLAKLHVRENQEVRAGDLLFEVANEVEKQRMALAQAQVKVAEANWQHADKDDARGRSMVGSKAISQQDYDGFHYRKLQMQARLAEAEAQVRLAEAELAKTQVRARPGGRVLQVYAEPGEMVGPARQQACCCWQT